MPAIITEKYRSFIAQSFLNGLTNNTTIGYLFVGRPSAWADASNVAVSDTNPPVPVDNTQELDFDYWRDLIAVKLVSGANSQIVIARNDWQSGLVYDQYDDTDTALHTRSYYVLDTTDSPYKVYKCCWNNNRGISNTAPSVIGTALTPTTTADGYVWQYMYTIDSETAKMFLTQSWMPVLSDAAVQNNALSNAGKLPSAVPLLILNGGAGYNAAAATSTTIEGDGSGASVTSNGVVITGGVVTRVTLATGGVNYTHVTSINVFQNTATTAAVCRAIIPPYPNHGYDPVKELGGAALMCTAEFDDTEGGKFSTANDYRRTGLLINPLDANGNPANAAFYKCTYDITLSSNTGAFSPDDVIVNQTKASGPFATVVDVVQDGNSNYVVRVTALEAQGETTPFDAADQFKCLASGSEGTVSSVSNPELTKYSGQILFVNQRTPVTHEAAQADEFKLIFPFRF